jgi:hypothetical protein
MNTRKQYALAILLMLSYAGIVAAQLTVPSGGSATPTVEGDVLVHAYATNIVLAGETNLWQQRIAAITDACTITLPAKASTNVAAQIWLSVPAIGTNAVGIATNSPPVVGYVPTLSTNAQSELLFWSPSATTNWRVRRLL